MASFFPLPVFFLSREKKERKRVTRRREEAEKKRGGRKKKGIRIDNVMSARENLIPHRIAKKGRRRERETKLSLPFPQSLFFAGALPCHQKLLLKEKEKQGRGMVFPRPSCPVSWVARRGEREKEAFDFLPPSPPVRTSSPIALLVSRKERRAQALRPSPHEQALRISKRAQVFPTWPHVLLRRGDETGASNRCCFLFFRRAPDTLFHPLGVF